MKYRVTYTAQVEAEIEIEADSAEHAEEVALEADLGATDWGQPFNEAVADIREASLA